MKKSVKKEVEKLIKDYDYDCSVKEFKDIIDVNWYDISWKQKLSEDFILEFKNKIDIKLYKKINRKISYL